MDTKEQAAHRPFSALPSCPQHRGALWPCGTGLLLRGDVQGFWPPAPVAQTATPTSAPFPCAPGRFPCQRPSHGRAGDGAQPPWISAGHSHPLPPWPHSPSLGCYTLAPPTLSNACSLHDLSAGRYFSDLHHSSHRYSVFLNTTSKWQDAADTMTFR